ncbi:MAG: ABC transporter ATP-binding protein [Deltaproteobacteria bacterium]|nr:ABC transporter ATP-binding protein [Deltaproteobacteria bacterium]
MTSQLATGACDARGERPLGDGEALAVIEAERIGVRYVVRHQRANATLRAALVETLDPRRWRAAAEARRAQAHWALREVSLRLARGEVLGVIGRNGAGKTTLLQTLAGVFLPDEGRLVRRGEVSCLLSLGAGFNGNLSGRENVHLNGAVLGIARKRIEEKLDAVIAFSDLAAFIDAPVRTYSAGMRARLGFSVALLVDPDVVILDEILRVGDAAFREKAGSILERFRGAGKSIVLASHSMDIVQRHCDRVLWLDRGRIRAEGPPAEIAAAYLEDARREQDRLGAAG